MKNTSLVSKIKQFTVNHATHISICALFLVALLSHPYWLNINSTFTHTDWLPWSGNAVKELVSNWSGGAWNGYSELGGPNVQINFFGFYGIWGILALAGLTPDNMVWLTFLMPILVLQVIGPFLLAKKIFHSNMISFTLTLFYDSIIYVLARESSHIPMVLLFFMTPLIIFLFMRALGVNTLKSWILFFL